MSYLIPPPFRFTKGNIDPSDLRVNKWIRYPPINKTEIDIGVVGVPLSRSSISASGASEAPTEIRASWKGFTTYDVDHDIDFSDLIVADLGDIKMHTTDIKLCHYNIEEGFKEFYSSDFIPFVLGGDHSITCPLVKGFNNFHSNIGIIQFDTHFDVRSLSPGGPSNGTPIRGLLESNTVSGQNIYQIGLHSFANSKAYKEYVDLMGITYYTTKEVREHGIQKIMKHVLSRLAENVDVIYVTIDIDVLDQACLPGSPGSAPGGLTNYELFEAVHLLGSYPKVKAVDLVCFDPMRDSTSISVRTATTTMLYFISGYRKRA